MLVDEGALGNLRGEVKEPVAANLQGKVKEPGAANSQEEVKEPEAANSQEEVKGLAAVSFRAARFPTGCKESARAPRSPEERLPAGSRVDLPGILAAAT
jgi:hypothetical protein